VISVGKVEKVISVISCLRETTDDDVFLTLIHFKHFISSELHL